MGAEHIAQRDRDVAIAADHHAATNVAPHLATVVAVLADRDRTVVVRDHGPFGYRYVTVATDREGTRRVTGLSGAYPTLAVAVAVAMAGPGVAVTWGHGPEGPEVTTYYGKVEQ